VKRLCITGAAGIAGTMIRPLLSERYDLTLFARHVLDAGPGETVVTGDLTYPDDVRRAVDGADAVIHLGGVSAEGDFEGMVESNILGTHNVLQASADAGIRRVLVASSFHIAGGVPIDRASAVPPIHIEPTSFYGASKAAVEALAAVHAHKRRMSVVIARIGTILERPRTRRHLATWLSPADAVRLIDATVDLQRPGCFPVWAISANARRWVDLSPGRAIGFAPLDDSEAFAADIIDDDTDLSGRWATLGGPWYGPDMKEEL
jgi:nucleoside-diphosphate-sugar epimerase